MVQLGCVTLQNPGISVVNDFGTHLQVDVFQVTQLDVPICICVTMHIINGYLLIGSVLYHKYHEIYQNKVESSNDKKSNRLDESSIHIPTIQFSL